MTAVPDIMVSLRDGTQVPWSVFRTWSASKQAQNVSKYRPSAETRAKMSARAQGREKTPEHRARIGQSNLGKKHTDETRALVGAQSRGRNLGAVRTPEQRERMRQAQLAAKGKCLMTPWGLFNSVGEAEQHARDLGIKNVKNRLREWQKTQPEQFYFLSKVSK